MFFSGFVFIISSSCFFLFLIILIFLHALNLILNLLYFHSNITCISFMMAQQRGQQLAYWTTNDKDEKEYNADTPFSEGKMSKNHFRGLYWATTISGDHSSIASLAESIGINSEPHLTTIYVKEILEQLCKRNTNAHFTYGVDVQYPIDSMKYIQMQVATKRSRKFIDIQIDLQYCEWL